MQIRLLGPLEIAGPGRSVRPGPFVGVLLTALVVEAGRAVSRARLVELLWGDDPPGSPGSTLRSHVSHLRKILDLVGSDGVAPSVVTAGRGANAGYVLRLGGCQVDADQFVALYREASQEFAAGRVAACVSLLDQASALWRGPALVDVTERPFVLAKASSLHLTRRAATRLHAESLVRLGRLAEAVIELGELVDEEPMDEGVRELLAMCLHQLGRTAEAVRLCRDGIERLTTGGLDPHRLSRLQTAILRDESLVSLDVGQVRPRQLPARVPGLVGRRTELDATVAFLKAPASRLPVAVIHGTAGIGKTALATSAGHALQYTYPDGQLFADLGGSPDHAEHPGEVLGRFLRALGMRPPEVPGSLDERVHAYRSLTADRRILVVLDAAANEAQVRPLLPTGPHCGAIVTSRTPLGGLSGHRLHLDVLAVDDALALLTDIVGPERVEAEPDVAGRIVQLCGRMPLAVWIAGTRLATRRSWSLGKMAVALADEERRLDMLEVGDVSVRAGLELTYQALDDEPRRVFRALGLLNTSAFTTWELAALVDRPDPKVERLVDALVEVHLVEIDPPDRHSLHDLNRLYAWEKARADETPAAVDEARRRLVSRALRVARETAVFSTDFELVYPSLVTAARQAGDLGDLTSATALTRRLGRYVQITGRYDEWRRLLQELLAEATREHETATCVVLHRELGDLETVLDDYRTAIEHFRTALAMVDSAQAQEDEVAHHRGPLLSGLGYLHRLTGRYADAVDYFAAARGADGRALTTAHATCGIGVVHLESGNLHAAEACFLEALRTARSGGEPVEEARAVLGLAQLRAARHELHEAEALFTEGERLAVIGGNHVQVLSARMTRADVHVKQGRTCDGMPVLERVLADFRERGNTWCEATALGMIAGGHSAGGCPDAAIEALQGAVSRWRRLGSPLWLARHLDMLACLYELTGTGDPALLRLEADHQRSTIQRVAAPVAAEVTQPPAHTSS